MRQGWSVMAHNSSATDLNLWCLLLPLLLLRLLIPFFFFLFYSFPSSSSPLLLLAFETAARDEATFKIAKTPGHFFSSLWIKCENPLAPKRRRLPVEPCFPPRREDISIQCAECCVKREMVSWGRSGKRCVWFVRALRPQWEVVPGVALSLSFFFFSAVELFGCREMLGNLHIWGLMWN